MERVLTLLLLLFPYAVRAEEGVEIGAVDVDFAAYLREGDEALVAVVLPRLGGDAEEKAQLLSMFEQSEDINKAGFIKNFLFQKPFKVFVVDENTRIFINQLSSLNALYRTYGVSYDTLVKTLRENFSEKKCNAIIKRLLFNR